jgi:iron complex transport system substrate-binding protein
MAVRAAALLVLVMVSASCGFKSEPIGSLPQFPQSATDALARDVVIGRAPARIVSLDPGMTEAVYEIGAGRLLVGGTGSETFPAQAAKLRPMLTEDGKPNLKAISRSGAELVLVPASLAGSAAEADRLSRQLGMEVYVTDRDSVKGIEHDILQLGLMTGHGSQARAVFADMQSAINKVTMSYADQPPVKVFVDKGYFYTIPDQGLAADLIRLAGGDNVAAGTSPSDPLTPQQLRDMAPEVYLAVAGSGVTLQGLRRSPATRDLPAVRDKRFAVIPNTIFQRGGPRVVESLKALAQAIHPDGSATQ